ncbi:MAG TPA: sigma-70 family RNA polymerase sigma factor [Planctomycetia bacterium]|nr:sigma-70 family RNA polymerase sigma factor [Planctomycetia bacterium]
MDADARLMQEVAAGRWDRFTEIVRRHQSGMFRYAASRMGNRTLAEEAVQEALLAAFRGRASFDAGRPFRPWLWRILQRECGRVGAAELKHRQDAPAAEINRIAGPLEAAVAADERAKLAALLLELPEEQAESLRLRFFSDLGYDEIGAVQGVPAATAKSRIRYGLAKLSERLSGTSAAAARREP